MNYENKRKSNEVGNKMNTNFGCFVVGKFTKIEQVIYYRYT